MSAHNIYVQVEAAPAPSLVLVVPRIGSVHQTIDRKGGPFPYVGEVLARPVFLTRGQMNQCLFGVVTGAVSTVGQVMLVIDETRLLSVFEGGAYFKWISKVWNDHEKGAPPVALDVLRSHVLLPSSLGLKHKARDRVRMISHCDARGKPFSVVAPDYASQ